MCAQDGYMCGVAATSVRFCRTNSLSTHTQKNPLLLRELIENPLNLMPPQSEQAYYIRIARAHVWPHDAQLCFCA